MVTRFQNPKNRWLGFQNPKQLHIYIFFWIAHIFLGLPKLLKMSLPWKYNWQYDSMFSKHVSHIPYEVLWCFQRSYSIWPWSTTPKIDWQSYFVVIFLSKVLASRIWLQPVVSTFLATLGKTVSTTRLLVSTVNFDLGD